MRGYELIYPSSNQDKNEMFNKMLTKANDIWDEFTTGKKHKMRHDQQRQKQPEKPKPQTPNDAKKMKTPVAYSTKA